MLSSMDFWQIPRAKFSLDTIPMNFLCWNYSQSGLLITSPGLTTTYEAFFMSCPTLSLPPQNLSQFFILENLVDLGIAPYRIHWKDLYSDVHVQIGLPESEGVHRILSYISRFQQDESAQNNASMYLSHVIQEGIGHRNIQKQSEFVKRIGKKWSISNCGRFDSKIRRIMTSMLLRNVKDWLEHNGKIWFFRIIVLTAMVAVTTLSAFWILSIKYKYNLGFHFELIFYFTEIFFE